jgi:hypothetical protein
MQRGRKSPLALTVIGPGGIETVRRPEPPSVLNEEQAIEWARVVSSLPADWFPPYTHGLLTEYCRIFGNCRIISERIEAVLSRDSVDIDLYEHLMRIQQRESALLAHLAVKLRLSPSSTYSKEKNRRKETIEGRDWSPRDAG